MKFIKPKIFFLFVIIFVQNSFAQEDIDWRQKFDSEINTNKKRHSDGSKTNNIDRILNASKSGNAFHFMYLGPVVDAFNEMYLATDDEKYLEINHQIINNIFAASKASKVKKGAKSWFVNTSLKSYAAANGNEWMLFEAHLFRYVIQYLYIVNERKNQINSDIIKNDNSKMIEFLEKNVWDKWEYASKNTRGDMTLFYGIRTHMGSHWATIALLLEELTANETAKKSYKDFYTSYYEWLKGNLKTKDGAYVWNSTWDNSTLKAHTDRKNKGYDTTRIQDTAHANHIIQYMITFYNHNTEWHEEDIQKMSKTLTENILQSDNTQPSKYVDGTGDRGYISLSDGWLKLSEYNRDCYKKFEKFYQANQSNISAEAHNIQYYAVMAHLNKK